MEAIRQIVRTPKNHEIGIKIPEYVPENETVEVILIIKKMPDSFKQKIEELKEAVRNDLFLHDLIDVSEDFTTVDVEGWVKENEV